MAHYLVQRLHVHFLKKLSLSWVPSGGEVMKLLRVATSAGSIVCFYQKQGCYHFNSLLSSPGSLQSSSNTPHITLSEFSLEAIFVQSATGF